MSPNNIWLPDDQDFYFGQPRWGVLPVRPYSPYNDVKTQDEIKYYMSHLFVPHHTVERQDQGVWQSLCRIKVVHFYPDEDRTIPFSRCMICLNLREILSPQDHEGGIIIHGQEVRTPTDEERSDYP